jgi:hypothetical protein
MPIPDPDLTGRPARPMHALRPDHAHTGGLERFAARFRVEPHPGDHDVRAEPGPGTWRPADVPLPLVADPEDGRCLAGCGHSDDDPRCTGVWRMSDFGEVPF